MRVLWAVVHALQKASKQMHNDLGITGPQRLVLRVVGLLPGASAGTVAQILHLHPSTLTGVLQRLVAQGLLLRTEHPGDRRRVDLRLSKRGASVNDIRHGTIEASVTRTLRPLRPRDRNVTMDVLTALASELNQQRQAAARPPSRRRPGGRQRPKGSNRRYA